MQFARYPHIGELVQELTESFGGASEILDNVDSKKLERFYKQDEISIDEYNEILGLVIENIVYILTNDKDKQKNWEDALRTFVEYYHQYSTSIETLGATQKQLDFILISHLIIPFVAEFFTIVSYRIEPLILDRILPNLSSDSTNPANTMQNAFELIALNLDIEKCKIAQKQTDSIEIVDNFKVLQSLLREILEENNKGYDTNNKNIANWLSGKHVPTLNSIKDIAKLANYCTSYTEEQITILFVLAKCIHYFIEKSCKYFGNDLTYRC